MTKRYEVNSMVYAGYEGLISVVFSGICMYLSTFIKCEGKLENMCIKG